MQTAPIHEHHPFRHVWLFLPLFFVAAWYAQAQATLMIVGGPSVAESDIAEDSAVVRWTTNAPATTVVLFGATAALGQSYRKIVPMEETEITEISHAMTLWSLEPGALYYYKVASKSEEGAAVESDVRTFTTKARAVPEPAPVGEPETKKEAEDEKKEEPEPKRELEEEKPEDPERVTQTEAPEKAAKRPEPTPVVEKSEKPEITPRGEDEKKDVPEGPALTVERRKEIDRAVEDGEKPARMAEMAPEAMPIASDAAAKFAFRRSEEADDAASVVLVRDEDADGLPDDFEKALGIANVDELEDRELDETAQALVSGAPLGQPTTSGREVGDFYVGMQNTGRLGATVVEGTELVGGCDPNRTCLIYVYSYIPVVLTVATGADGNWSYDLADTLKGGTHTAYVAVTDRTGKVTKKSRPFAFLIPEAVAAAPTDLPLAADANVMPPEASLSRWYALGALLLVVTAAAVVSATRRRSKTGARPSV